MAILPAIFKANHVESHKEFHDSFTRRFDIAQRGRQDLASDGICCGQEQGARDRHNQGNSELI